MSMENFLQVEYNGILYFVASIEVDYTICISLWSGTRNKGPLIDGPR